MAHVRKLGNTSMTWAVSISREAKLQMPLALLNTPTFLWPSELKVNCISEAFTHDLSPQAASLLFMFSKCSSPCLLEGG